MKIALAVFFLLIGTPVFSQDVDLTGVVRDSTSAEILAGASVLIYRDGHVFGTISNANGEFLIRQQSVPDSVRVSMIGYRTRIFHHAELNSHQIAADLYPEINSLHEVSIHPLIAQDIVKKAAGKLDSFLPSADFEGRAFYREIIRDTATYYSVSEAIFRLQVLAKKKLYRLKLEKGRSKEDVKYSRLFEDFHPGGGPEDAVNQSLIFKRPAFVDSDRINQFIYKMDSLIQKDGQTFYIIHFDQKADVHEALEKGRIFINADDFSILRYEAINSPLGTAYIKSLRGTDKIMAEILHIDLMIRGWSRTVDFEKIDGQQFLSFAKMEYRIGYKQPRKDLDLNLNIHTEWAVTEFRSPIRQAIEKSEEWKRKNLTANLPADFDPSFWGSGAILDPTTEVKEMIQTISRKNNDSVDLSPLDGWSYFNKEYFVAGKRADSLSLIPIAKSSWDDGGSGGMIYKTVKGDFSLETKISVQKRSNPSLAPDNGFQQSGIMLRKTGGNGEDNCMFSLGTGGSSTLKYFLRKTENGKSKTTVEKINDGVAWLRMERHNHQVNLFYKTEQEGNWQKVETLQSDWLEGEVQVGFSVMARFAGDGPKQKPDMKATYTDIVFRNE